MVQNGWERIQTQDNYSIHTCHSLFQTDQACFYYSHPVFKTTTLATAYFNPIRLAFTTVTLSSKPQHMPQLISDPGHACFRIFLLLSASSFPTPASFLSSLASAYSRLFRLFRLIQFISTYSPHRHGSWFRIPVHFVPSGMYQFLFHRFEPAHCP